jgi:acetylornithine deacetylase/succinyl-diaminopimelate desuccinylase-like protein
MLSLEEKQKALASLVDGTEVFVMDGEIAPGSILYMVTEGEEEVFVSEGKVETTDGLIVTVGENGVIASVEPKVEEVSQEEIAVEVPEVAVEATGELLEGIAELLAPFIEEVSVLTEEFKKMKQRFNAIADEPASNKIKTKQSATSETNRVEERLEILKKIRRGN